MRVETRPFSQNIKLCCRYRLSLVYDNAIVTKYEWAVAPRATHAIGRYSFDERDGDVSENE